VRYRHSGSPRGETSRVLYTSESSASNTLPMKHLQESPQDVLARILDNDTDVDPSDLTIVASPDASDKDVDTTVEQTCEKIKLTASNVRNIIRVSILSWLVYLYCCSFSLVILPFLSLGLSPVAHTNAACYLAILLIVALFTEIKIVFGYFVVHYRMHLGLCAYPLRLLTILSIVSFLPE